MPLYGYARLSNAGRKPSERDMINDDKATLIFKKKTVAKYNGIKRRLPSTIFKKR